MIPIMISSLFYAHCLVSEIFNLLTSWFLLLAFSHLIILHINQWLRESNRKRPVGIYLIMLASRIICFICYYGLSVYILINNLFETMVITFTL